MIITREAGARPIKAWLGTKEVPKFLSADGIPSEDRETVIDVEDAALQQTKNIPGAYKRLDVVMDLQKDLVEVIHVLKAVLCVKGN